MKIFTVVGARPQFVKAATVSRVIRERQNIDEILVHTGQHFDPEMSKVFFEQMDIPEPDYNLEIAGLSHGAMTGRMLEELEKLMQDLEPDWVLVYGDTNSTLAGALAAAKIHIRVAHVEAGLRSFNMRMPEEINRILTDRISSLLFCPTGQAMENLNNEGFAGIDARIIQSGDVMQDAAQFYAERSQAPDLPIQLEPGGFALCTIHRAENTNDLERLTSIVLALNEIGAQCPVVLPLHPRTRMYLDDAGLKLNVHLIEPVGYLQMIWLLQHCETVITDSGGLQKEAFFFRKPCITLRDETEWVELVHAGVNRLTGANSSRILEAWHEVRSVAIPDNLELYGNGNASGMIVDVLSDSTL